MHNVVRPLGVRQLTDRVNRFAETAREMAHTVENDPRDLTSARKYLGVYLLGARDAAQKFAEIWARTPDDAARARFEGLLDDLEHSFAEKTGKMLIDDLTDLDIEIDVLRERLERDGIRAE